MRENNRSDMVDRDIGAVIQHVENDPIAASQSCNFFWGY
jgi:hypothetical protein